MATWELTEAEAQIMARLRELARTYDNFTLSVYGQGTVKRRVLDLACTWRVRLQRQELKASLDD